MGVAAFNDACRTSVLRYTDEWRAYVTRQARWVDFDNDYKTLDLDYMESVMWAFKTLWDKGLVYSGFRVLWYCWRCETPLSCHRDEDGRRLHGPAGSGRHGRAAPLAAPGKAHGPGRRVRPDLDDDAVDAAVEPGRRGAPGRRVRAGRDRGHHGPPGRAVRPRRGPAGRLRPRAGRRPARAAPADRRRAARHRVRRRRSTSSPAGRTRTRCWPPTTSPPTTAPGSCTSRRRSARRTRSSPTRRASRPSSRWTPAASSTPRCRRTPGCRCSTRTRRSSATCATGAPHAQGLLLRHETYDHPYPHCWRCGNPLIQRAVDSWFVEGHAVPRPDGRAEPADHLGARPHQGRPVRQVAGGRARLVDLPQPVLGQSPIPVWVSDDPRYPRTDVYGSLDELERDFGVRPTDLHRPFVDDLTRPNPDDPTGNVDHAPGAGGARLLVRVGLDAVRAGALPVRERRLVRAPLPGRLHRRVQRPDPRLVLHAARAGHGAVRPAGVPLVRRPRHRAGRRRREDAQVAQELPGRQRGLRARRLRRHALVPHGVADPARRQPGRHRAGHPRGRAPGDPAAVEHLVLPVAVRERGRPRRHGAHRLGARARPVRAGEDRGAGRRGRPRRWTCTTSPGRASGCATTRRC